MPFLLDLVEYDTVKTLKGIVYNQLLSFGTVGKSCSGERANNAGMRMFTAVTANGGGKRRIDDDESMALSDLGLAPNGVIHVSLEKVL